MAIGVIFMLVNLTLFFIGQLSLIVYDNILVKDYSAVLVNGIIGIDVLFITSFMMNGTIKIYKIVACHIVDLEAG